MSVQVVGHADNDTRSQRRATVSRVRTLVAVLHRAVVARRLRRRRGSRRTARRRSSPASTRSRGRPSRSPAPASHVVNLTPPGAEPHDVELSPSDVETISRRRPRRLRRRRLPAGARGRRRAARTARRSTCFVPAESDPHIWLDPVRFAQVVQRDRAGARSAGRLRDELERTLARARRRATGAGSRDCARTHVRDDACRVRPSRERVRAHAAVARGPVAGGRAGPARARAPRRRGREHRARRRCSPSRSSPTGSPQTVAREADVDVSCPRSARGAELGASRRGRGLPHR